jgi:N-acetylmuramic acid 6-phosphate etherase
VPIDYKDLKTEMRNPESENLDLMPAKDILSLFYRQDITVVEAVKKENENIGQAIELISRSLEVDGRVFYAGAGTSGRLGVLDASEIKPTFGVKKKIFIGLIAGGRKALTNSIEGAEDDGEAVIAELKKYKFGVNKNDVLVGITASGMTPYVLSALNYAISENCATVLLTCNKNIAARYSGSFDVIIAPDIGSEIISGSTRLKSGTATKMILNMLSSVSMIKLGKVYQNYMVDLIPSCKKLVARAERILSQICLIDMEESKKLYSQSNYNLKAAILIKELDISLKEAGILLKKNGGHLRSALIDGKNKRKSVIKSENKSENKRYDK